MIAGGKTRGGDLKCWRDAIMMELMNVGFEKMLCGKEKTIDQQIS